MVSKEYDITIVGGGPGGYVAAIRAAQLGARVALVERDRLGGTCLNRGCIPTKALARSAEALQEIRHAPEFGVRVGQIEVDFPAMMSRKERVVAGLVSGIEGLMQGNKIDVYSGVGHIASPRQVRVDGEALSTRRILIATGSVPARIPIPGLDLPGVITSDEILELEELPQSLVVIGGGIIGMEFASIFSVLGSSVTVVEMLPMILPPMDEEIARRYLQLVRSQGIQVKVGAPVKGIWGEEGALAVHFETSQGKEVARGEKVLLAVGRVPYSEGLGLDELGVRMERRTVAVNSYLETNVEGIYAIGDVIGGIMLAHVASYEGEIAVENALGSHRQADYHAVPNCIFTIPEIASVGMTEKQVKEAGLAYKVSRFPFSASSRAHTMGETAGTVKLICEEETGRVLGLHVLGPRATDIIAEGTVVMQMGGTARDIAHTIHAHPTLPEAIFEAALGQLEGSIHLRKL